AAGAVLVIPAPEPLAGEALLTVIADQRVSHALLPPAALAGASPAAVPGLRTLIVGGEVCPADLVRTWSPDRRMINGYGPTEATACATASEPLSASMNGTAGAAGVVPIGRPIANTRVYVLDAGLHPVPV